MKKFNIKVNIESTETNTSYNAVAIIEEDMIKYIEIDNTNVILDIKNNILNRENEKIKMKLEFNIEEITINEIYLKDLNSTISIMVKTKEIIKRDKFYKVEYEIIDNDNFKYSIEVGERNE